MPYIGNIVQDFSVNNAMLNTDSVTSIKIDDGTIVNADINDSAAIAMSKLALSITNSEVNASAAIAGSKISPDFGSQNILTTGKLGVGTTSLNSVFPVTIQAQYPGIQFLDAQGTDSFGINADGGVLKLQVGVGGAGPTQVLQIATASTTITNNLNANSGLDVTGNITTTGSATIGTDLIHAGDTDTKLSFGTDTISVSTNGVTRMTFTGNFIDLPDAGTLRLGNSNDLKISHGSGGASNIEHSNTSQPLKISATGAGNIAFLTNSNERMRVNSSGNVGIGTTSPVRHMHLNGSDSDTVQLHITNSTTGATGSDGVSFALGSDESLIINQRESNHIALKTADTERMRISSTGNVGINSDASGPDRLLHVSDTNNTSHVTPFRLTNTAGSPGTEVRMEFECGLDEIAYISAKNEGSDIGPLIFATASSQGAYPTEKARIRQNGAFGVGTNANRVIHAIQSSSHGTVGVGAFENGDSSNNHAVMFFATVRDGNAGESFLQCNRDQDNSGQGVAAVFFIRTNGDCDSATNSYGGISDITLKENIVDAKSQWDDIKNIKVRNFNFKDNPGQKMLGVVAQEVETVSAGLVKDCPDENITSPGPEGTSTKSVKYSILYMKAIKALQEAMTRIETLEAEVAALKTA